MKLLRLSCFLGSVGGLALHAGPVESAIVAAMKLAEHPSYSWVSTVDDDVRTYDVVGMTRPDGFTRVRMPMTDAIRRRLGRAAIDSMLDVIYHGKSRCVIETVEGWKSVHEISGHGERRYDSTFASLPVAPLGLGLPSHSGLAMSSPPRRRPRARSEIAALENYSNLGLGLSHPHEELGVIVSSHADLRCEGDTAYGALTEIGALLLLVPDEHPDVEPRRAAGSFKLWIRGGVVTKYQVKLAGTLIVSGRELEVQQTSTTVLKDIGVTRFQIPDEARQKLSE